LHFYQRVNPLSNNLEHQVKYMSDTLALAALGEEANQSPTQSFVEPKQAKTISNSTESKIQETRDWAEVVRACTPITLAVIGGIIGVSAIFSPNIDSSKLTSAMGLAGAAIAGAAGLAQPNKSRAS
jgi:hypothetical protein